MSEALLLQILEQSNKNAVAIAKNGQQLETLMLDNVEIKDQLKEGDENFKKLMPFMEGQVRKAVDRKAFGRELKGRAFTGFLIVLVSATTYFGWPWIEGWW